MRIILLLIFISVSVHAQMNKRAYDSLIKIADDLYRNKKYKMAAHTYSQGFKEFGWRAYPLDRYNAACCWARAKKPDSAFRFLQLLIARVNYADYEKVYYEPAFKKLKRDKRWQPMIKKIKLNRDSVDAALAKINKPLIFTLDSMVNKDQFWRGLSRRRSNGETKADSIDVYTIGLNMRIADSMNYGLVRKIFFRFGYPGFDIVGSKGSGNFWLFVQHQDRHPEFQDSVLTAMKAQCEKNNASWTNYAYLLDRVKVNTGEKQIYGTQMQLNKEETSFEPKPFTEPEKLNERRKSVGLNTIEEYTQTMNSRYQGSLKKN